MELPNCILTSITEYTAAAFFDQREVEKDSFKYLLLLELYIMPKLIGPQ